ncbi:hypothetical protein AvCA_37660 [Azotobacter vinelandii CA]|uniref:Uncharacterized protein n=2 Tax=Azotobacter vinelandii TaxID=354 RepID=C1DS35_AZOVD|nr:hypothetical protein Avin_37660 [Azotobacter vinelandii DJ]AGK16165.1 hypothetical protein AvCA_37660 [Azotobacter vinelandii CA]AGK21586.1 hypothetical protein AvCA6_37660 [Azotobacter vinelandii CA6]
MALVTCGRRQAAVPGRGAACTAGERQGAGEKEENPVHKPPWN